MKKSIRQSTIFYALFVFMLPYMVYASYAVRQPFQQMNQENLRKPNYAKRGLLLCGYCRKESPVLTKVIDTIRYYLYVPVFKYQSKKITGDSIANLDLSFCDLRWSFLNGPNVTNTNFYGALLEGSYCDYLTVFNKNQKERQDNYLEMNFWKKTIRLDIIKLQNYYSSEQTDPITRTNILLILCGLSRLPLFEGNSFNGKLGYWYYELKKLKDKNSNSVLLPNINGYIAQEARRNCWETKYKVANVKEELEKPHDQFEEYIRKFKSGFLLYVSMHFPDATSSGSENIAVFWCYYNSVLLSIMRLKENYHKIDREFQEKACYIASQLSKSYQYGRNPNKLEGKNLLAHLLHCQNQLIELKELTSINIDFKVFYTLPVLYRLTYAHNQSKYLVNRTVSNNRI